MVSLRYYGKIIQIQLVEHYFSFVTFDDFSRLQLNIVNVDKNSTRS